MGDMNISSGVFSEQQIYVVYMPNADTSNSETNVNSGEAFDPPSYNSLFGRDTTASTNLRQTPPHKKPIQPGSLYLHFCRLEKMVPTFLVVFGVFAILAYICCIVIKSRKTEADCGYWFSMCCLPLIGIFLVVWLLTGSVYLFGSYTTWNTDISLPTYCIPTLYYYAFWTTTIFYSLVGLSVIVEICAFCIKKIKSV